ncbi:hypothetical protein Tco_1266925, partial [Tanacetum coccineum]
VLGAYSNGVINNKAALERQHINAVEADIRHNLVQSTGPGDLFSLNNGHLTTSFLDSLPTATRENVQKAMSCFLVHVVHLDTAYYILDHALC